MDNTEPYCLAGIGLGCTLKGAKRAHLSVRRVTKVELVIEIDAAKSLGFAFPPSVFGRADRVIA